MKTRVRELRTAAGMTQQQLAEAVHVSARTIISIEKEQYSPSLTPAYRLAEVFGVTVGTCAACGKTGNRRIESMKIYYKKNLGAGLLLVLTGARLILINLEKGVDLSRGWAVFLCLFVGGGLLIRSLSREYAREDKLEELDKRNRCIRLKVGQRGLQITQDCLRHSRGPVLCLRRSPELPDHGRHGGSVFPLPLSSPCLPSGC